MNQERTNWDRKHDPFNEREAQKYEQPIPSREFIIEYLTKSKSPKTREQLLESFELYSDIEQEALRRRLRAMVRDGQLMIDHQKRYHLLPVGEIIVGRVVGEKSGEGYIEPEDGTSPIYLSPREMRQVFDGDLVGVRLVNIDQTHRREGKIVQVIEHNLQTIVGHFFSQKKVNFLKPANPRITQEIVIPVEEQNGAINGQMVVAEIITPPTSYSSAVAKVVEVLGDYLAPGLEIEVAIRSAGIPHVWPDAVLQELKPLGISVRPQEYEGREDLRYLALVTIDGDDAQDFDDAVYCERNREGGWDLYVAIADVSHYVKPGTALDEEAKKRSTSVYFPGRVVPMLPETLSNELCCIRPDVDRLSFVCQMKIGESGLVQKYEFYKAVIHSHARLTYNRSAAILFDSTTKLTAREEELLPHLQELHRLYVKMRHCREERGALDFERPEFKIEFDENKKIRRLIQVEHNDAHRIVEEAMIAANACAGELLTQYHVHTLFRVHDNPPADKLYDLRTFLKEFGLSISGGDLPTPLGYAKLLREIKTRPDSGLLQTVVLRSLAQATFSPHSEGHFGLALENYAYFTSPIRRYPDLMVHRAIQQVIEKKAHVELMSEKEWLALCEYCAMAERRADEAADDVIAFLKCEFMAKKLGRKFSGIISGVMGFGLFVQLDSLFIDGLVHISNLGGDYFVFEPTRHRLVGKRTGRIYRLGDPLEVQVVKVDLEERQIDFLIVEQEMKGKRKKSSL